MAESLSLLSNFQKILSDRIEELTGRIHEAHNPVYNESLMIEIETCNGFYLRYIDQNKNRCSFAKAKQLMSLQ